MSSPSPDPTPSPTPLTDEELDNYACSHCDAPKGVECDANCVSHRLRKAEVTAIRYRMALEEITRLDGNQVGPNIARAALAASRSLLDLTTGEGT